MDTTSIEVDLGARSYRVLTGRGILSSAGAEIRACAGGRRRIQVVSNEIVWTLHGAAVEGSVAEAGYEIDVELVPDGEEAKSLDVARGIYSRLVESGHERTDPILALGGGVIGDLAGFVAGTYMRGVPFVQAPTTLLAQVDAAIGGKTAVNLPEGKNLVGVIWQPRLVLADVDALETLPDRQVVAGLAEVIKAAMLAGGGFLETVEDSLGQLLARDPEKLAQAITASVELKARVVRSDENDQGERAVLNLGHTVGHALEQQVGYGGLLHGEAVALGLEVAAAVAEDIGVCDAEWAARQRSMARRLGVSVPHGLSVDGLITQMYRDKKVHKGALRMVLLRGPGRPELVDVPEQSLRAGLADVLKRA